MPSRTGKQHRLTDILVEEVSNVDRAANKRKYLVVKRDDGDDQMATKLVADGRGGYMRVRKSDDEETSKKEQEEAEKAFPPGAKAPPFGAKPAAGEEEEEGEEEKAKRKAKKAEARKSLANAIQKGIEVLLGMAESVSKAGDEEDEEEMKSKAKKALDDITKSVEGVEVVAKAGRKMSKERLDRFSKALNDLSSVLKEVMSSPELPDAEKSFDKPDEAGAAGTGVATDPQLVEVIADLSDVVKQQDEILKRQAVELETIRKSMGTGSNARGPVEKSFVEEDDGDWPMDMNRPITKRNTPPEHSFY